MDKIKVMSEDLANKIAAGEILERPLSVVKELCENSIDAGADKIIIRLKQSGIREIIIEDNGSGMSKNDLEYSIKRHASSKVTSSQDLFNIQTLGFRGEALATIYSVSHFTILSSPDGKAGYQLTKIADTEYEMIPHASNQGTKVIVQDLFYNLPMKYKHLSSLPYELSLIVNYVQKMALINRNISYELYNDDKNLINYSNKLTIPDIFANMFDLELAKSLYHKTVETLNFQYEIFFAHPRYTRASRKQLYVAINDRLIKNYKIEEAIIKGYKNYVHTGQYPIAFIKITTSAQLVDPNNSATKQQVNISLLDELLTSIAKEVNKELVANDYVGIADIKSNEILKSATVQDYEVSPPVQQLKLQQPQMQSSSQQGESTPPTVNEQALPVEQPVEQVTEQVANTTPELALFNFDYVGTYDNTYLLFENEEGLFLLDQHAAQERINYEKIMKKFENKTFTKQIVMLPILKKLTSQQMLICQEQLAEFTKIGLTVEVISDDTIRVTEMDDFYFNLTNFEYDFSRLIDDLVQKKTLKFEELFEDIAILMACKSSIKAHQYLNIDSVTQLIKDLKACHVTDTCPHGRPIVVKIEKYTIEKMFKRVF